MKMDRRKVLNTAVFLITCLTLLAAVLGPEALARYKDRSALNQITVEEVDTLSEGYRYTLSSNEKLYLLSECLNHQVLPESELSARTRAAAQDVDALMGTYAFVMNRQGAEKEDMDEDVFAACNREMDTLKELGILPQDVKEVEPGTYTAVPYSAIDVLEPQKNMSVWKLSLSTMQQNANKAGRLIDVYMDGDTGKIYSFYARTERTWTELKPEAIMENWSAYLGLTGMEEYTSENPLLETTPDFLKYRFPGMDESGTIVTIGFYEGINELFLKIV